MFCWCNVLVGVTEKEDLGRDVEGIDGDEPKINEQGATRDYSLRNPPSLP